MIVRVTMESDQRVPDDPGRAMYKETWTIDRTDSGLTVQYAVMHPVDGIVGHSPDFAGALQIAHDEIGRKYGEDRQKWNAR